MGSTVSFNRNQFVLTRFTRELKQRRRRRLGRRQVKNEFIFYKRNLQFSRSVRFANGSKIVLKLNMQRQRSIPNGNTKNEPSSSRFCRRHRTWPFHVLVLQRTTKKCTKSYNTRAQPLFCSLNLLFGDVLVAVAVVVSLSSLVRRGCRTAKIVRITSGDVMTRARVELRLSRRSFTFYYEKVPSVTLTSLRELLLVTSRFNAFFTV